MQRLFPTRFILIVKQILAWPKFSQSVFKQVYRFTHDHSVW